MNILNGPEYVSRVTCYYLVEIKLEGNPLPNAFTLEAGGKTLQFTTETGTGSKGKGEGTIYDAQLKLPVGVSGLNNKCEDMQITSTASNKLDIKNKASASIVLPWVPPPEGMFGSSYDYLEISSVKGKFQMKREKRMLAGKFETEDYPKWETYEGVGMIWIGDEIKTADEPLIIPFLEDG